MDQITCGDVGLERAVIMPKNIFRLKEFASEEQHTRMSRDERRRRLDSFLTYRCTEDFLAAYIKAAPAVLTRVAEPGLALDASSEVDRAVRLPELGLLPETQRKAFVVKVMAYAFEGR
jgi:hypothetical protein